MLHKMVVGSGLHVVIVKSKNVGNLSKRFSQVRLVEVAGVVVEVGVADIFFVLCSPWSVLSSLFSTSRGPLLQ